MGISGGPYIVRDSSLVLELDAADKNSYPNSGTNWYDVSGNGYNATMSGSLIYNGSFPNSFQYITGSNNYFLGNNSLTGSIITGVTIMSWIKMNDISTRGVVLNKYISSAPNGYSLEADRLTIEFKKRHGYSYNHAQNKRNKIKVLTTIFVNQTI